MLATPLRREQQVVEPGERRAQVYEDPELPAVPNNILDMVTFGRRLRSLRMLKYDRASDITAVLASRYGLQISDRSYYAIERGEQMCPLDIFLAVLVDLQTSMRYFFPAMRGDVAEELGRHLGSRRSDP
jgi:hypothetical protein